jgi:hypothetical protein
MEVSARPITVLNNLSVRPRETLTNRFLEIQ